MDNNSSINFNDLQLLLDLKWNYFYPIYCSDKIFAHSSSFHTFFSHNFCILSIFLSYFSSRYIYKNQGNFRYVISRSMVLKISYERMIKTRKRFGQKRSRRTISTCVLLQIFSFHGNKIPSVYFWSTLQESEAACNLLLDFEPGLLGPTILLACQVPGPSLRPLVPTRMWQTDRSCFLYSLILHPHFLPSFSFFKCAFPASTN